MVGDAMQLTDDSAIKSLVQFQTTCCIQHTVQSIIYIIQSLPHKWLNFSILKEEPYKLKTLNGRSTVRKLCTLQIFLNCRKEILTKKIALMQLALDTYMYMTYCYIGTIVNTTTKIAITKFSSLQVKSSTGCLQADPVEQVDWRN